LSNYSQPLSCIFNLSYPHDSILPQAEEFLIMLDGFVALLFVYLVEHLEALGIDFAKEGTFLMSYGEIPQFKFGITEVIILTS
jgi:hypothetical protein